MLARLAELAADRLGYTLIRKAPLVDPLHEAATAAIIDRVMPFTLTSRERVFGLIQAVRYVAAAGIPGAIVECGVWRGGGMMAAALTLRELGETDRELVLYDTFEGMPAPGTEDVNLRGEPASRQFELERRGADASSWCYAPLEEVTANLATTGYPPGRIAFVKGKVEVTIPARAPDRIAVLRLDTDWYESTRHELTHLFPRLAMGGVLIIDDYGHWRGSRRATDEYFAEQQISLLLTPVDYTCRVAIKCYGHHESP